MSGVTSIQRNTRSSHSGKRTLPWLNIAVAFRITSNSITATGGAPSSTTTAQLDQHGQHDFQRMEAQGGGDIEIQIGVVHPVQAATAAALCGTATCWP
jgi:hypothetical protein